MLVEGGSKGKRWGPTEINILLGVSLRAVSCPGTLVIPCSLLTDCYEATSFLCHMLTLPCSNQTPKAKSPLTKHSETINYNTLFFPKSIMEGTLVTIRIKSLTQVL